jgi:hypothetical protein
MRFRWPDVLEQSMSRLWAGLAGSTTSCAIEGPLAALIRDRRNGALPARYIVVDFHLPSPMKPGEFSLVPNAVPIEAGQ